MLSDRPSPDDVWCPLGDSAHAPVDPHIASGMTHADRVALARLAIGEWNLDAQIDRLQALGLVERVFGHPLLTRLGRSILGATE